ncbi:MAG: efflux RND transporter periplasmic adaptor subunit [Cyanobacteria bacterium SZAS LIN-3]|nr:efflux RND transporter periplasmic adaptor subunit [Cyanobacteria bacterium SZAS LIN-3]MBS2005628.1 efflux RND transporter periplasmic adaptor subunit [Cyanobacteria bacterium SZAS TMP-1]
MHIETRASVVLKVALSIICGSLCLTACHGGNSQPAPNENVIQGQLPSSSGKNESGKNVGAPIAAQNHDENGSARAHSTAGGASGTTSGSASTHKNNLVVVSEDTARRIELKTEKIEERDLVLPLHLTGHVEPDTGCEVDVSARITGRVTKILVKPGEFVKKGQLLAMIDSREVAELEGEMVEAKSKLDIAQAHAERERQVYEEQLARPKSLLDERARVAHAKVKLDLAQSDFRRIEDLYKEKIAAAKDFVAAKAAVTEAHVEMDQAQTALQREQHLYENRVLMKKDYQLAIAEVTRERQHLTTIIKRLEFIGADRQLTGQVLKTGDINGLARIVAPIDGGLSRYEVAPGEMVHPETSMFKITNLHYVQIYADLPEVDVQRVKLGDHVKIKVPGYPNELFQGTISLISQRVHLETRTLPIRARLVNPSGKLKPNMYAEIDLEGTARRCLACPKAAVQEHEGRKIVFVKQPGGFEERPIKLGASGEHYFEVLSGLTVGESVATQGSLMLKTELSYHH